MFQECLDVFLDGPCRSHQRSGLRGNVVERETVCWVLTRMNKMWMDGSWRTRLFHLVGWGKPMWGSKGSKCGFNAWDTVLLQETRGPVYEFVH